MDKKIAITYAKINVGTPRKISASKLRGYMGHLFIQDAGFHHHDDNPYRYPLVQYKSIAGTPMVLGIKEYAGVVLDKISGLREIVMPGSKAEVTSVEFSKITHRISDKVTRYEFQTPWIALNSTNYEKFRTVAPEIKHRFLENILVGNFLSALKGMGIWADYKIYASIEWLRPVYVTVHKNPFHSFHARLAANIHLPDLIGVGNSVSKGFGAVKRLQ